MQLIRPTLVVALAAALSACASGTGPASSGGSPSQAGHDRNVITQEELAADGSPDMYSAIRHLRPEYLVTRGGIASMSSQVVAGDQYQVSVYLNNTKMTGGTDALKDVSPNSIKEVRYMGATDATQRFGMGNLNGAIVLTSR